MLWCSSTALCFKPIYIFFFIIYIYIYLLSDFAVPECWMVQYDRYNSAVSACSSAPWARVAKLLSCNSAARVASYWMLLADIGCCWSSWQIVWSFVLNVMSYACKYLYTLSWCGKAFPVQGAESRDERQHLIATNSAASTYSRNTRRGSHANHLKACEICETEAQCMQGQTMTFLYETCGFKRSPCHMYTTSYDLPGWCDQGTPLFFLAGAGMVAWQVAPVFECFRYSSQRVGRAW